MCSVVEVSSVLCCGGEYTVVCSVVEVSSML